MFKILAVSLVALTFSAFAQETVCYKAKAQVPAEVPAVLCLESIYEGTQVNVINVDSKNQTLPFNLTVTDIRRHNEERYKFSAEYEYVNFEDRGQHCGEAREVKLVISGRNDYGKIDPKALEVVVENNVNRDPCNLATYYKTIKYEIVK